MRLSAFRARSLAGLLRFGVALAIATTSPVLPSAHAQNLPLKPPTIPLLRSVPSFVGRAATLGPLNPQRTLRVILSLKFAHPNEAQAYADAVSDPKSPLYRHYLTPAEIAERFGPSVGDYAKVVAYLRAQGLRIV